MKKRAAVRPQLIPPGHSAYASAPVAFIDDMIPLNEKGKAWQLSRHQRRVLALAFRWDTNGRLLLRLLLWGEVKKSGKSFLGACLTLWWSFINADTEIILAANDLEQVTGRVFRTIVALCRHNPQLAASVTVRATEIQVSNGTLITAVASDYKGAAGSRHSLYVVDEPWGIMEERAVRFFEELTPPPTEENAWGLMTTTAGWVGESKLLEGIYERGLTGERLDAELEVYRADDLVMFWSHTPRQPWQTARYYAEQQRSLRPATFARLHRNEWVSAESVFITPELWDPCVDQDHRPLLPDGRIAVVVGVDAGIKHDNAAVVVVARDGDRVVLVQHRLWKPTFTAPLDLEATVEAYLSDLVMSYAVEVIYADPYQMHRSITTLQGVGVPITEYPQTAPNTTKMGQVLFDLLKGRTLVLYPDAELRQQALNTVAIETPRGFRIAKEKASKKIDSITALAMACCAALDTPVAEPVDLGPGPEETAALQHFARTSGVALLGAGEENDRAMARLLGGPPVPFGGWANVVDQNDDDFYLNQFGQWVK